MGSMSMMVEASDLRSPCLRSSAIGFWIMAEVGAMSSMPQRDWFEMRAMVHSIGPWMVTLGSAI